MDALQADTSTTDLFSNPLTVHFGPNKARRLKAMEARLNKKKYMLLQERNDHIDRIEDKQKKMEKKLEQVLQLHNLAKN